MERHVALQPTSREHHYGLLLSWKIREGLKRGVALKRIKDYTDWFWQNHLKKHFEFEEEYIFPILGRQHQLIKRAMREHGRLKRLFARTNEQERNLNLIEEELVGHIRFEERVLFKEIERLASEEQFKIMEKEHSKTVVEDWPDEFWA